MTVAVIISIIALLTQAGLNPARDLSTRLFAYLAGWGNAAFADSHYGFLTVYVFGPSTGGILSSLIVTKLIKPLINNKEKPHCDCR
jgi:glycerol uptake facilitator protein